MSEPFQSGLKPHELPRATLVDLWDRTVAAHEYLTRVWTEAVTAKHGPEVARDVGVEGWPLRTRGATPKQLFFDDLRFVVAATALKPEMLTVANRDRHDVMIFFHPLCSPLERVVHRTPLEICSPHATCTVPSPICFSTTTRTDRSIPPM